MPLRHSLLDSCRLPCDTALQGGSSAVMSIRCIRTCILECVHSSVCDVCVVHFLVLVCVCVRGVCLHAWCIYARTHKHAHTHAQPILIFNNAIQNQSSCYRHTFACRSIDGPIAMAAALRRAKARRATFVLESLRQA